jgi:hypothetical protein
MITALNAAATGRYVLKRDPARGPGGEPLEGATIFHLRAMDSYIQSHLSQKSTTYEIDNPEGLDLMKLSEVERLKRVTVKTSVHIMAIEACRLCIIGWDNFVGADGKPIEFKTVPVQVMNRGYEAVLPSLIAQINKDDLIELYSEIDRLSTLTETQIKNSAAG